MLAPAARVWLDCWSHLNMVRNYQFYIYLASSEGRVRWWCCGGAMRGTNSILLAREFQRTMITSRKLKSALLAN